MSFQKVDMKSWERRNEFFAFTKIMPGYFSFTADIDITAAYKKLKELKLKIFPATLYITNKAVNSIPEFRYGYENHELVIYDCVYPMFPYFHESTCSCSLLWLPVNESFGEFHEVYKKHIEKYGGVTDCSKAMYKPTPRNIFNISVEHRINFSSASVIPSGNPAEPMLNPIIVCGKYVEKDGRMMMPVSVTVHHAVSDGYHVSRFFETMQDMFSSPYKWAEE